MINITLHGPREEVHKREEAYKRAFTSEGTQKVQVASVQGRLRPSEAAKAQLRGLTVNAFDNITKIYI